MTYRQSALSEAIDEIYALRALIADEADILRAHLDYKTFPKSRRRFAEEQLERMRLAASADYWAAQRHKDYDGKRALQRLGIDDVLTNGQWLESRGYDPRTTTHPPTPHGEALRAGEVGK